MSADVSSANVTSYRLPNRRGLLMLYLPVFAFLFLVGIAALHPQIPVMNLTRDMATIARVHPLTGVVSNAGILLWCATAAICFFSFSVLRGQGSHREARFLLWAGMLTTALLVDDFFLFHEYLAPVHFHLNENVVHASYVCVTGIFLLRHRRLILEASYVLLAVALTLFASSILLDLAGGHGWWALAEDSCKLLGVLSWFGYYAGRAKHWLMYSPGLRSQTTNVVSRDVLPVQPIQGAAPV
jgi:hypothetical protein